MTVTKKKTLNFLKLPERRKVNSSRWSLGEYFANESTSVSTTAGKNKRPPLKNKVNREKTIQMEKRLVDSLVKRINYIKSLILILIDMLLI